MPAQRSAALQRVLALVSVLLVPLVPHAQTARLDLLMPVVGEPSTTVVTEGETLLDIAFAHGLGFDQLVRMNPDVDVWIPDPGTRVVLPTQVVLPSVEPRDLVINVPEMRLYDFRVGDAPDIISIAVGDAEDPTPIGSFRIGSKRIDPAWHVPESILAERPGLPPVVPPGPENPLGDRWMTIGSTSYGIHGTNNRWSIGHDATHGCVRLYNDDMRRLYERTPEGTAVQIVYQPVKLGRRDGAIYLEVHPDLYGLQRETVTGTLVYLIVVGLDRYVDRELVRRTLEEARGIPVRVGTLPEAPISGRSS